MPTKAEIKLVRSLADRQVRRSEGLFVAEGAKLVGELVASGMHIEKLFSSIPFTAIGVDCHLVGDEGMQRLSHLKTHASVLALVHLPEWNYDQALIDRSLCLALDGVQDPGNLGTIIRLADWFGIGQVICSPDTVDCFNPKVVQSTMGSITRVSVHYLPLEETLSRCAGPVYGTFLEGDDIYRAPLTPSGVIVMGSEGRGISDGVSRCVTRKLLIPPYNRGARTAESLNVATAAAIVCSEFRRPGR